jgi:predicted nucleic acid-binding protein
VSYLLDTNILVRWANPADSNHALVTSSLVSLHRQAEELYIARQNLVEFWAVATRAKANNGLEWTIAETRAVVDEAIELFTVLPDNDQVFAVWLKVVEEKGITGFRCHDARIAATAIYNGITHLLTINVDDFKRFTELTIVNNPADVPLVS